MKATLSKYIIGFLIGFYIGCIITRYTISKNDVKNDVKDVNTEYTEPILPKIDTIYETKDSIINRIKYIREIQHDTIKEVYNITDSASVKLFYELVSK